jgi:hypothetical protein
MRVAHVLGRGPDFFSAGLINPAKSVKFFGTASLAEVVAPGFDIGT